MKEKVFLDCDTILDLLLERKPHFTSVKELFGRIEDDRVEGFTSPLIFANLYYIIRKTISSPTKAKQLIAKLKLLLHISVLDGRTIDLALASSFSDFEDAIQYYSAVSVGASAIITRNTKDYRESEIAVYTAQGYLSLEQ